MKMVFFIFVSAFWRLTNFLRRIVRVESSQLFAGVGQQLLGAIDDTTLSRSGDLSAVLARMECG